MPVVGVLDDEAALRATTVGGAREPQGEVVGLAPRVDEEHHAVAQPRRHRRQQPLGELAHVWVEVPRVGVERGDLLRDRVGDGGVGVADVRHVVARVEEDAARFVDQPRAVAAHDQERVGVGVRDGLGRAEVLLAHGEDVRLVEPQHAPPACEQVACHKRTGRACDGCSAEPPRGRRHRLQLADGGAGRRWLRSRQLNGVRQLHHGTGR
jgi:hypothetical protein